MIGPRGRRLLRHGLVAAVASCAAVGCGADATSGPNASTQPPGTVPPIAKGGPLVDLPQCDAPPEGIEADVAGLVLPDGAVVTDVEDQGPLVSVRAYVEKTPIQVRQFYAHRPGLELFELEDETYESEVLFGGGSYRVYVKAQAQCAQGSLLLAYVGKGDSGALPSVAGG